MGIGKVVRGGIKAVNPIPMVREAPGNVVKNVESLINPNRPPKSQVPKNWQSQPVNVGVMWAPGPKMPPLRPKPGLNNAYLQALAKPKPKPPLPYRGNR